MSLFDSFDMKKAGKKPKVKKKPKPESAKSTPRTQTDFVTQYWNPSVKNLENNYGMKFTGTVTPSANMDHAERGLVKKPPEQKPEQPKIFSFFQSNRPNKPEEEPSRPCSMDTVRPPGMYDQYSIAYTDIPPMPHD